MAVEPEKTQTPNAKASALKGSLPPPRTSEVIGELL
jgi:hypothetical protein